MRIIAFFAFLVIILQPHLATQLFAQDSYELEDNFNNPEIKPAKSKTYGFSLGTQFGFIHGQSFELVYPVPNELNKDLYSELIWDIKPVFYLGIEAEFGKVDVMSSPGFYACASFKAGIPCDSGKMEDRDWDSPANDSLTRFSKHTNKTKEMYMADLFLGASIPVKSYFYIKPFLSGSWMHFSFSGRDGYRKYEDENWVEKPYHGEVITYKQDWLLVAAGFSIGTEILRPFLFELSFKISPFAYCAATDEHKVEGNKKTFKDFTYNGIYLEPAASVSFVYKQIEFSLNFAYRHIGRTEGKSYIKEDGETQYGLSSNKAGAELYIIDTRLLVIWHF